LTKICFFKLAERTFEIKSRKEEACSIPGRGNFFSEKRG
jgi:hypothetical protein